MIFIIQKTDLLTNIKSKSFYNTIDKTATAEFKDRGSKFIAYAFPIQTADDFKLELNSLKKEHPKAVHHCFAYRIGNEGINFRVSDDGEPSGSAGRPILGQIDSKEITDVAIVVVRYFGGTLLGVPGLINAYKTAAALCLQVVPVIRKQVEIIHEIHFDYTQMNAVMQILKQYNCTVINPEMQLFCIIRVGIPAERKTEILYKLKEVIGLDVSVLK